MTAYGRKPTREVDAAGALVRGREEDGLEATLERLLHRGRREGGRDPTAAKRLKGTDAAELGEAVQRFGRDGRSHRLSLEAGEKANRSPLEFLKETFHVRLRCGPGIGRIESPALSRDEVPHVPRSRSFGQRRDGDALRRSDGELASSGTNEEPLPILFDEPGGRERRSETGGERLNELKPRLAALVS